MSSQHGIEANPHESMTGHPKVDTALLAGSGVIAADQIMEAIKDHRERHPEDATGHYVKAGLAAAVAIGAYEMLKKDEEARRESEGDYPHHEGRHHVHLGDREREDEEEWEREERRRSRSRSVEDRDDEDPHHGRHLLQEAVGAYALGRQAMGHKQHPIVKLVAEALGATGLYEEAKSDLDERR
jgi:hypothetical protein